MADFDAMQVGGSSKWLKHEDLRGEAREVVIEDVDKRFMDKDDPDSEKIILSFVGKNKLLALNFTNKTTIIDALGRHTSKWVGKTIVCYPDKTQFGGKMVDCLRVRVNNGLTDAHQETRDTIHQPIDEDDIPF